MDDGSHPSLLIILVLLGLTFYFAVAETALSSVSRTRVKTAADRGDSRAKTTLSLLDDFDRAITTLLICTNILHISIASIVTVYVTRRWGLTWVSVSTIVTTIIVFFIGEMVPKSIAKKNSESCALACAGPLSLCMKICAPLSAILSHIGNLAASLTTAEPEVTVTEDELYDIIEDMEEEGSIDEDQSDLISSALQFSEVTVDSIITPRVDMIAIDVEDSPEEILKLIQDTNHSRLPVYDKTPDNIIGILQIRDFMKAYLHDKHIPDIRPLCSKPCYMPQSTPISEMLENMSQQKVSLAVISDSYGGTLGIVTVEDILEELVGEIWDEDDKVDEPIIQLTESTYLVDAEETVGDALDEAGVEPLTEEDDEEFTNLLVGEWVYEQLGEIPNVGDHFKYGDLTITVAEMDKNRIIHVRFTVGNAAGNTNGNATAHKQEGGDQA